VELNDQLIQKVCHNKYNFFRYEYAVIVAIFERAI
jgi:hypothetical protein